MTKSLRQPKRPSVGNGNLFDIEIEYVASTNSPCKIEYRVTIDGVSTKMYMIIAYKSRRTPGVRSILYRFSFENPLIKKYPFYKALRRAINDKIQISDVIGI